MARLIIAFVAGFVVGFLIMPVLKAVRPDQ